MAFDRKSVVDLIYRDGPVQRFTQDSPVLPDVWIAFAERNPGDEIDLLLTPFQEVSVSPLAPGELADHLDSTLQNLAKAEQPKKPRIAYNQSTVAASLTFANVVKVVLPLSAWWKDSVVRTKLSDFIGKDDPSVTEFFARRLAGEPDPAEGGQTTGTLPRSIPPDVLWSIRVIGTIALAHHGTTEPPDPKKKKKPVRAIPDNPTLAQLQPKDRLPHYKEVVAAFQKLMSGWWELPGAGEKDRKLVHLVSLNRPATTAIWRSSTAVKADAAGRVFGLSCSKLFWVIADSGIDAKHPAFRRRNAQGKLEPLDDQTDWGKASRVVATYDFTIIREKLLRKETDSGETDRAARETFKRLQDDLTRGREIDWSIILPLIQMPHNGTYKAPLQEHGTHVAGILGADWRPDDTQKSEDGEDAEDDRDQGPPNQETVRGICPDIQLYDFRVLDDAGNGDEFSVMAALQAVRYLNAHKPFMVVHGVNMSLSIRHDVVNYACGRTPICDECERAVGAGVVVVAAAGNAGYKRDLLTQDDSYRGMSITDPGNADAVITVGATHRDAPHTYGVSYFSSRGPTGDGRLKPDLVAPGEKIEAPVPGTGLKRKDGTSMAAPHVSGAAALLLSRHYELIGQPRRIKEILCTTATDLGRERYFQGAGMLDILRALQAV